MGLTIVMNKFVTILVMPISPSTTYAFGVEEWDFLLFLVKRGLYKSSKGILINADINGALNILRKSGKTDFKDFDVKNIFNVKKINILKINQKACPYGVEVVRLTFKAFAL